VHEFSLAQGLFDQLLQLADTHRAEKIIRVRVEIGKLSGIVTDSFSFGFEVLAEEKELTRGAVLDITEKEPDRNCLECGERFPTVAGTGPFFCPRCGSSESLLTGGDDLILTQVEME